MVSFLTVLGVLGLSGGLAGYFVFPMGMEFGVKSMINLGENGLVYPKYMNPPFKSTASYYIYEIKNPR